MYKCNYCGRHLKKKRDNCPGCGANDFTKLQNYGEIVLKTPPKGGYIVNVENFKHKRKEHIVPFLVATYVFVGVFLLSAIFIFLPLNSTSVKVGGVDIANVIFAVIGGLFLIVGIKEGSKIMKMSKDVRNKEDNNIERVKYLSNHGILIKNLKYKLKDYSANGAKTIYKIQVIYEIEKGKTKCFESEPKFLSALGRDDGTVDLLVDPNDWSNYFIDFEIY